MKKNIKNLIKFFFTPFFKKIEFLQNQIEINRILTAKMLIEKNNAADKSGVSLYKFEFKVFSEWGEDGIIQYLISKVPIKNEIFIEFGVENYKESNTRFLLMNNNWKGLIMDSNPDNIKQIMSQEIYWRYDLTAVEAFITKENINELIKSNGISGDIGLLSIDIDGNDYWVWDAINVISPRIVICEYNNIFGSKEAVTVPYNERFYRTKAHYSNLYFGTSIKALCFLASKKGYIFVGSNKAGSNAFFVRKDVAGNLQPVDCETGYVASKVRESRDEKGNLTFLSGRDRIKIINNMKVIDVITNQVKKIDEISV